MAENTSRSSATTNHQFKMTGKKVTAKKLAWGQIQML